MTDDTQDIPSARPPAVAVKKPARERLADLTAEYMTTDMADSDFAERRTVLMAQAAREEDGEELVTVPRAAKPQTPPADPAPEPSTSSRTVKQQLAELDADFDSGKVRYADWIRKRAALEDEDSRETAAERHQRRKAELDAEARRQRAAADAEYRRQQAEIAPQAAAEPPAPPAPRPIPGRLGGARPAPAPPPATKSTPGRIPGRL